MHSEQSKQTTVGNVISFDGIGLHSGRFVRVEIHPAAPNSGIQFRRIDITESSQTINAHPENVEQARLCTRISNEDGVRLETVEHIMAAFAGLGIDNAIVQIDSGEAPILDGSSLPVVEAILRHVALTPCELAIIPLEDIVGLVEQPNLPGTTDQHPNWRRRMPASTEELLARPEVARRIADLDASRP